jgi:hypothetical protein
VKRYVVFALALLAALVSEAQSRTVVIDTPDVDPVVMGAVVLLLADGGCTLRVLYTGAPVGDGGIQPQAQAWPFSGQRCTAARSAIAQASYRDNGVGDGGAP